MAIWQFWTLIGVISTFGIWAATTLSAIYDQNDRTNHFLVMLHDDLRGVEGALSMIHNDVEAIKYRAQRD
jgi:hypothetical protein